MAKDTRIVEVNGVKLEIDLSQCRVVENYRVGDPVKVLTKEYTNDFKSHVGTIVGFDNFKELPTIIIAYLETSYAAADIKFVYFNAKTENIEICPINKADLPCTKAEVLELLDTEITKEREKVRELENKKNIFLKQFGKYFESQKVKV